MKQDIKDKVLRYLLITLAIIIFILSIISIRSCNKIDIQKKTIQTINAMNDSLVKRFDKNDTFWQKQVITLPPKVIIKEKIVSTNKQTNDFIKELEKEKNLSAALQIIISSKDSLITILNKVSDSDSNIENENTYIFEDSTRNLKYIGFVNIGNKNSMNLSYTYKTKIKSVVIEDKDKYVAKYSLDDDNGSIEGADFILIPKAKETKWEKAKKWVIPTITGVVGFGVGYSTSEFLNHVKK